MRDFIFALILLAILVWAFSGIPFEENTSPSKNTGMYLPTSKDMVLSEEAPSQVGEAVSPTVSGSQNVEKEVEERPIGSPEAPKSDTTTKTIEELAWEVIIGLWDYTEERWRLLTEAGYDADAVQDRVDEILESGYILDKR